MSDIYENKGKAVFREVMLDARCPRLEDLSGVYMVRMLTGLIPDFSKWNHRKAMGGGAGFNLFWQDTMWGYFSIKYDDVAGIGPVVLLDYDHPCNSFLTRRIRDYVREVMPGLYIGTFNYILNASPRFVGYFWLKKQ